jgi:hypothetical protein
VGKIKIEPEIVEPGVIVKPERMSWLHVIGRWCNQLAKPLVCQIFIFIFLNYLNIAARRPTWSYRSVWLQGLGFFHNPALGFPHTILHWTVGVWL